MRRRQCDTCNVLHGAVVSCVIINSHRLVFLSVLAGFVNNLWMNFRMIDF